MKIKDKLFLMNKKGNFTNDLTVVSNFTNNKEINEYADIHNVNICTFKNKKGKNKLYVGDKISFLTAKNEYNLN